MQQDVPQHNWHSATEDAILQELSSHREQGISPDEAVRRVERHGLNRLSAQKGKGPFLRFLLQFHQPLIYILLLSTVVTAFLGEWVDAGVIFGVVLINAVVGFLQEAKALKALEALAKTIQVITRVIRDGKIQELSAEKLVPGDIILLQSGDKVPADIRLLYAHELRVDESSLTGESVPVEKQVARLNADTMLADRGNLAFASTLVTHGQARGIVVTTGNDTEIGHISRLIAGSTELETPLTRKIRHFSSILLYLILALAALAFAVGIVHEQPAGQTFMAAVALAVAAIPEGLPAAFTIILAIGVSRMAERKAIIRKLPAVETLGGTTVICTDKTGTLTVNNMTVTQLWCAGGSYRLSGVGYNPEGQVLGAESEAPAGPDDALTQCLLAGLLCNDAQLVEENGHWKIQGDPTEGALLVSACKAGLTGEHFQQAMPRLHEIPFESEYQYMATLHKDGQNPHHVVYVKGAVEKILDTCIDMQAAGGQNIPLDREQVLRQVNAMAENGLRVLAFARLELPEAVHACTHEDIASGLTFLGIQGMIDPPREEAMEAIAACHRAGIAVKMITGDHATTAAAIAREMHISEDHDAVLTGKEMAAMPDTDLSRIIPEISVFARVTPEQKLRLVNLLQAERQVVAMTGDGVNDAPALKQADIGVAMGQVGTEVAKEAADMMLMDDNFATIAAAVEEGRCVFDNLTKFIVWTLPTSLGEAIIVLCAIFAGYALPVLPVHILWINMTTTICLGLMLVFERKEQNIMQRSPRNPDDPILTRPLVFRIFSVSILMTIATFTLFQWELSQGASMQEARTMAVNAIVFVELFYLFNCRSLTHSVFSLGLLSNLWLLFGIACMVGLQLLFTYLPLANQLFHTAPVSMEAWYRILTAGFLVFVVVGMEKWIREYSMKHMK